MAANPSSPYSSNSVNCLTEFDVMGDDELVLGGSGTGSDITLGAADSGISLANPADSGLSLEEPFDLTDTGSSQLNRSGSTARARPIPIR